MLVSLHKKPGKLAGKQAAIAVSPERYDDGAVTSLMKDRGAIHPAIHPAAIHHPLTCIRSTNVRTITAQVIISISLLWNVNLNFITFTEKYEF